MPHTPGPWTNHSFTVQDGKGRIIADVCVKQSLHAARMKPSEFEANGALIAAAPDLLAACKTALSALLEAQCDAVNVGGKGCAEATFFDDTITTVRAAIRKAAGK